jgi:hypothetical protein
MGLLWGNFKFAEINFSGEGYLIQWIGIRSLVTGVNSPYSDLVSSQIQESIGDQDNFLVENPTSYTSPLYSAIVVLPFALIKDNNLSRAIWLTMQLISIFIILLVAMKITDWRPSWYIFLIFSLLITFSYHVFIPWLDGGLAIWAALFLALAFLAIRNNRNEVGGVLLALSAIEPQMTILIIVFTLIYVVSKRKYIILIWFCVALISLSIVFYFLVPGWIFQYLRVIYHFSEYFPSASLGMLFKNLWPGIGKQLGWAIAFLSTLVLIVEWYLSIKKDFRWFLWTACLTLVIGQWIGLPIVIGNYIFLILPVILVSAMLSERWPRGGPWIALLITAVVFFMEWFIFINSFNKSQPGLHLNLIIPLPIILFFGLYWVRWWAIKPKRLYIEELRLGETI